MYHAKKSGLTYIYKTTYYIWNVWFGNFIFLYKIFLSNIFIFLQENYMTSIALYKNKKMKIIKEKYLASTLIKKKKNIDKNSIVTFIGCESLSDCRKKNDHKNPFLYWNFWKFRPTASILVSCILLASIIFALLVTYSHNVTPTCQCILVAYRLHFRTARSRHSHAKKSTKRYSGIVKMRMSPALEWIYWERSERKQSPEPKSVVATKEVANVFGVNCCHHPLCFDSISLCLALSARGDEAVPSSLGENCRSFKFIYFPPFTHTYTHTHNIFYSLRFPWSRRSQFQSLEFRKSIAQPRSLKYFQQFLLPLHYWFFRDKKTS